MGLLRSLILGVVPRRTAVAMEQESRRWRLTCPQCGAASSVWDLGGLRYGAAGRPWRQYRCPACRRWVGARMAYDPSAEGKPSPSVVTDGGGS
jgi:hypothetical protein